MPTYRVNAATVSWISKAAMQPYAGVPWKLFEDDAWLKQLAYGMAHTANPDPPPAFDGGAYQSGTLGQQFRALATFTLGLKTDSAGRFEAVTSLQPKVQPDPGYTPPFDSRLAMRFGAYAQEAITISPGISSEIIAEASRFSPGESSSLSDIAQPATSLWQTQATKPLPYGSIRPPAREVVLAHSLVKFRAGAAGDRIGIVVFGAPNHVPWVWCEMMLTYAQPSLVLYCAGSTFPSHAFYLGGQRRETDPQHVSAPDLKAVFTSGPQADVSTCMMPMGPDMPPRPMLIGVNSQAPANEPVTATPVDKQQYSAPANPLKRVVVPVATMPLAGV